MNTITVLFAPTLSIGTRMFQTEMSKYKASLSGIGIQRTLIIDADLFGVTYTASSNRFVVKTELP